MFDPEAFEERAAIMEFDGGLSRFEAETLAARAQGLSRWQALRAVQDAKIGTGTSGPQARPPGYGRNQPIDAPSGTGSPRMARQRPTDGSGRPSRGLDDSG